jgi:hypothetical protein
MDEMWIKKMRGKKERGNLLLTFYSQIVYPLLNRKGVAVK